MFLRKQYGALKSLKGEVRDCTGTVLDFNTCSIQLNYYTKFRMQEGFVMYCITS